MRSGYPSTQTAIIQGRFLTRRTYDFLDATTCPQGGCGKALHFQERTWWEFTDYWDLQTYKPHTPEHPRPWTG